MPELVALFAFKRLNAEEYPEDERYGEGSIKIVAEREPETQEDFTEIAKAIFQKGEFEEVAVTKVFYDDENLFKNLVAPNETSSPDIIQPTYIITDSGPAGIMDDVIEGEIVDE